MINSPEHLPLPASEADVRGILEWLAAAHDKAGFEDADQLYRQLLVLRDAAIPNLQRLKLLDLLYPHADRVALAELPRLRKASLPISRKQREHVRLLLDILETLTQDYFNSLAEFFDPEAADKQRSPISSLRRTMETLAWQVRITHLIAAPTSPVLWQQLHSAFRTARRLGVDALPGAHGGASIREIYISVLLAATAQPASFSPPELEFIENVIGLYAADMVLQDAPPPDSDGIFWVDLDKDAPAHALIRRIPPPDAQVLYFSCAGLAEFVLAQRTALLDGASAELLGLPAFADTSTAPGTLQRLSQLWGHPTKRRFPRRRQSYRANLCSGLGNLWQLMKSPASATKISEWMITNESPDGYSLMHMKGHTRHLRVGDIVALQALGEHAETPPTWHVCIIRWAVSENPEHIELGLQTIAPKAIAVEVAHANVPESSHMEALILPATPPLRPTQSLVVPAGLFKENTRRIVVLIENDNLEIREVQASSLDEQTSAIEIFNVLPET